ncbi:MAG: hypothetical protein AAGN35_11855 [Bacteroidota bacterium]
MKLQKTLSSALMSALETSVFLTPLGVLLFYPFVAEYDSPDIARNLLNAALCMAGFSAALAFLVLVPATVYLEWKKQGISRKELAGSLATLALVLVLTSLLVYKGFEGPGQTGLRLLFGLLMSIMAGTWVFALRYHRKAKLPA